MTNDARPTWPRRFPAYRAGGLVLALLCGAGLTRAWLQFVPPLQRFYLPTYLAGMLPRFEIHPKDKTIPVAFVGTTVATDDMLQHPAGPLAVRLVELNPKGFQAWLLTNIYDGKSLGQILLWPLIGTGVCALFLVGCGGVLDRSRNSEARNGRLLRGPGLISRWKFNQLTKGDGLAFHLTNPPNLLERFSKSTALRIRRDREAHHIQVAGDTGAGKSTVIRDILYQIEARGEVAIVFDPDREYLTEFFDESRRDWVLNPKDERCPYWPIGDECDGDEAEATALAIGLFPDDHTSLKFFLDHTRAIFAYLLAVYRPTVGQLAHWFAHPEEIDKRVAGTEHASSLTENAAPQRAGILGSLNQAGKPLRIMPTTAEGRRTWTVREWAKLRHGWIFITSTPATLDALRPLQSLWLDLLILTLQSDTPKPGQARVWIILDELPALNALPQLHSALTRNRKSDCPIVLGFQGMAQLEKLYGKTAETILSQAYSNIVLRTREPKAAEHLSKLIGRAQLERIRESMPAHWFGGVHARHSFSSERVVDDVVMPSEIQGLEDLSGYFVQGDKIVAITFTPRQKRIRADGLIERKIQFSRTIPEAAEATPAPATVLLDSETALRGISIVTGHTAGVFQEPVK